MKKKFQFNNKLYNIINDYINFFEKKQLYIYNKKFYFIKSIFDKIIRFFLLFKKLNFKGNIIGIKPLIKFNNPEIIYILILLKFFKKFYNNFYIKEKKIIKNYLFKKLKFTIKILFFYLKIRKYLIYYYFKYLYFLKKKYILYKKKNKSLIIYIYIFIFFDFFIKYYMNLIKKKKNIIKISENFLQNYKKNINYEFVSFEYTFDEIFINYNFKFLYENCNQIHFIIYPYFLYYNYKNINLNTQNKYNLTKYFKFYDLFSNQKPKYFIMYLTSIENPYSFYDYKEDLELKYFVFKYINKEKIIIKKKKSLYIINNLLKKKCYLLKNREDLNFIYKLDKILNDTVNKIQNYINLKKKSITNYELLEEEYYRKKELLFYKQELKYYYLNIFYNLIILILKFFFTLVIYIISLGYFQNIYLFLLAEFILLNIFYILFFVFKHPIYNLLNIKRFYKLYNFNFYIHKLKLYLFLFANIYIYYFLYKFLFLSLFFKFFFLFPINYYFNFFIFKYNIIEIKIFLKYIFKYIYIYLYHFFFNYKKKYTKIFYKYFINFNFNKINKNKKKKKINIKKKKININIDQENFIYYLGKQTIYNLFFIHLKKTIIFYFESFQFDLFFSECLIIFFYILFLILFFIFIFFIFISIFIKYTNKEYNHYDFDFMFENYSDTYSLIDEESHNYLPYIMEIEYKEIIKRILKNKNKNNYNKDNYYSNINFYAELKMDENRDISENYFIYLQKKYQFIKKFNYKKYYYNLYSDKFFVYFYYLYYYNIDKYNYLKDINFFYLESFNKNIPIFNKSKQKKSLKNKLEEEEKKNKIKDKYFYFFFSIFEELKTYFKYNFNSNYNLTLLYADWIEHNFNDSFYIYDEVLQKKDDDKKKKDEDEDENNDNKNDAKKKKKKLNIINNKSNIFLKMDFLYKKLDSLDISQFLYVNDDFAFFKDIFNQKIIELDICPEDYLNSPYYLCYNIDILDNFETNTYKFEKINLILKQINQILYPNTKEELKLIHNLYNTILGDFEKKYKQQNKIKNDYDSWLDSNNLNQIKSENQLLINKFNLNYLKNKKLNEIELKNYNNSKNYFKNSTLNKFLISYYETFHNVKVNLEHSLFDCFFYYIDEITAETYITK